jgi:predicted O-linked N-acetylglucosamine transferase (SPINDLY family)
MTSNAIAEAIQIARQHHLAGRLPEAESIYREILAERPDQVEALQLLGMLAAQVDQFDAAVELIQRAIAINSSNASYYNNLGNALRSQGRLDDAIAAYRQSIRIDPQYLIGHSNLLYSLHYHPSHDAGTILDEHRRWNQMHIEPLGKVMQPHGNNRDPDRRLRIGYVSPDFRMHCQLLFTIPLLSNHDRRDFEIFCYSSVGSPDAVTGQIRGYADGWQSIVGMTDADVARKIREDRIDVLVDLSMHMGGNRLVIFADKPAPVQVAWLAYPGTTGLPAMDYRLTDPLLDPPGTNDHFYFETSIRLPETFWCYDPFHAQLAVNALPAESQGFLTFGCLNSFCKVNQQVVQLWARVLKIVARSRLMILCPEGSPRERLLNQMQMEGIDSDRIELVAHRRRLDYLELYHRIDLGLDTFPYNGHTTSLDSFWMGVPVVTLVGQTVVGRAGLSQLTNLGLTELIAHTPDEYVAIAARLAGDLPRLAELRRTLRSRMEGSPLMDAPRFARNIEAAYRQMWRNWCARDITPEPR